MRSSTTSSRSTPDAAAVGESTIHLRAGRADHRARPRRGRAHPERERRRLGARRPRRARRRDRLRRADERGRAQLGLADTHFVRPDGLDAPGPRLERPRRDAARADRDAEAGRPRRSSPMRDATIAGGRRLHTWNDLLGIFPGLFGVKTGPHDRRRAGPRSPPRAVRASPSTRRILGSPTRATRNDDLAELIDVGARRASASSDRPAGASTRAPRRRTDASDVDARGARAGAASSSASTARSSSASSRRPACELPVGRAQQLGEVRVYEGGKLIGALAARRRPVDREPGVAGRAGWYAEQRRAQHVGLVSR